MRHRHPIFPTAWLLRLFLSSQAPELLDDTVVEPSPPQDCWSLGVLLWELLTWQFPFGDVTHFMASDAPCEHKDACKPWLITKPLHRPLDQVAGFVQLGGQLEVPPAAELPGFDTPFFSGLEAYTALMRRCLSRDPAARPTAKEAAAELAALLPAAAAAGRPRVPPTLRTWEIEARELTKIRELGRGAFGRVRRPRKNCVHGRHSASAPPVVRCPRPLAAAAGLPLKVARNAGGGEGAHWGGARCDLA